MKAKFQLMVSVVALLVSGFAAEATPFQPLSPMEQREFPNSLGERHFFTLKGTRPLSKKRAAAYGDCRANIERIVCVVDPIKEGEKPQDRTCLAGSETYAAVFEELHDRFPPAFQKMFCSLDRIFIEKNFVGTAYAGSFVDDQGKPFGSAMGIRKSVLDERLNLQTWASWKEQLSFGGVKDSYTPLGHLPSIYTQTHASVNDFLYFVVAHEFGHFLDFANGANATYECDESAPDGKECIFKEGTWGSISWQSSRTAKSEFRLRKGLCFYWCEDKPLALADVTEVYSDLWKSSFISIYAASQAWDDFADSMAYYAIHNELNASYVIDTRQGAEYDIMKKLRSEAFRQKYEYIDAFLKRADLIYP